MRLESQDNGTYVAQWVPAVSGNYLVQVYIDGRSTGIYTPLYMYALPDYVISLSSTGQEKPIEVFEPELPPDDTEEEAETDEAMAEEQPPVSEEKTEPTPLIKMKLFDGKTAIGLRIRSAPSLTVSVIFIRF